MRLFGVRTLAEPAPPQCLGGPGAVTAYWYSRIACASSSHLGNIGPRAASASAGGGLALTQSNLGNGQVRLCVLLCTICAGLPLSAS